MEIDNGDSTLTIGDLVVGGGANRVLFEDGSERLATDSDFTYVAATNTLTVDNITSNAATALVLNGVANITFSVASTQRWGITASGHFVAVADNTYDIGAIGATRPRSLHWGSQALAPDGAAGAPSYSFGSDPTRGFYATGTESVVYTDASANILVMYGSGLRFGSGKVLEWSSNSNPTSAGGDTTFSRAAAGIVGVTSTFRTGDGVVGTPAYSFTNSTGSGMWWDTAASAVRVSVTGTTRLTLTGARAFFNTATAVVINGGGSLAMDSGSGNGDVFLSRASAGNFTINNGGGTIYWTMGSGGILAGTDNSIDIGAAGATRPRSIYYGTTLVIPTGSAAAPAITDSTGTSGFYVFAAASWGWSSGGTIKLAFTANGAQAADGSAGSPAWSFMSSPTTGLWHDAANVIGFSTAGTGRWKMSASGHFLAYTDNSFDIGATGATRPRSIYVATSINIEANNGLVTTNQTSGPGASVGTLTNAPSSGDPDFWHPISVNGTNGWFPIWYA